MHTQTIELLTYLDKQRALLRGAFEEVPAASRQRAPAPGRWSAVEVIEHVGMVERLIGQRLAEAIAGARADHVGPEQATEAVLPTFTAHLTRLLDRRTTIEAPPAVRPTGLSKASATREDS
jgi:DinB family protein